MNKLITKNREIELIDISPICYNIETNKWDEIVVKTKTPIDNTVFNVETDSIILTNKKGKYLIYFDGYTIDDLTLTIEPNRCQFVPEASQ